MSRGAVDLFATCLVDLVRPEAGEAAVRVLRRAGYEVRFPEGQTCCGQPAWNSGFPDEARTVATTTLRALGSGGAPIVGLSGSCVATVLHVWPELFEGDAELQPLARDVCARLEDFGAFLAPLGGEAATQPGGRTVAYHCSCHQRRGLGDTESGPRLLDSLGGVERRVLRHEDECCGFGGTFSISFPHVSTAMGRDKAQDAIAVGVAELVSGDLGCLLHLDGCARAEGLELDTATLPEVLDREGWKPS